MHEPLLPGVDRIHELASTLAGRLGPAARSSTSIGVERAIVRMLGVQGLDRAGVPLAASVVERAIGTDPARIGRGVLLPFAAALLVYELSPQELALDIASGSVDLDLEAEALIDPERRAMAEAEAHRLIAAAFDRIDANRTARHELLDVLGDAASPWVGVSLRSSFIDEARDEAAILIAGGADLVRVLVPASRELADRLHDLGLEPDASAGFIPRGGADRAPDDVAPAGSQRALAVLRGVVDEAAAERRAYARLATTTRALAAPEQATVAAFERVDVVEADPMGEIVDGGVDPERALADHAFARRLARRAGSRVVVGAGPIVVAPDLVAGEPASPAVRAGRALALQALSVALAHDDGLGDGDLLLGSLPAWMLDERSAPTNAIAHIALQRALFPGISLALAEPAPSTAAASRWAQLLAPASLLAGGVGLVHRDIGMEGVARAVDGARTAVEVGSELRGGLVPLMLSGPGREHADRVVEAAIATLRSLEERGWDAVAGSVVHDRGPASRLAARTVAPRTDGPDVLGAVTRRAGQGDRGPTGA